MPKNCPQSTGDKEQYSGILERMDTQHVGFLLINKPKNLTSFAAVKHIRKLIGKRVRVGHTGTLDPFATGLLIIAIDRKATKHIDKLLSLDKIYYATGKLGVLTDTLDRTGEIIHTEEFNVTTQDLKDALASFGDSYIQTAPFYSALKYRGMKLYDLARNKQLSEEELESIAQTKKREVQLYKLELLGYESPYFIIRAQVSRGTYVRSLINDIAKKAGSSATTYELERTAIGPFTLENALPLNALSSLQDIEKHLLSIDTVLNSITHYTPQKKEDDTLS